MMNVTMRPMLKDEFIPMAPSHQNTEYTFHTFLAVIIIGICGVTILAIRAIQTKRRKPAHIVVESIPLNEANAPQENHDEQQLKLVCLNFPN